MQRTDCGVHASLGRVHQRLDDPFPEEREPQREYRGVQLSLRGA